jgi:cyclophilin family peptidyl-prolyl cis-trans isomerase
MFSKIMMLGMVFSLVAGMAVAGDKPDGEEVAVIKTDKGAMVIKFYPEAAPEHVENFKKLAKEGFYNGLTFHRVVEGFVIQGGDPDGNGTGGPGYKIPAEIGMKHTDGAVAMARTNNPKMESSGSQFYICLGAQPHLDGAYTVFGQVIEGLDVSKKIARGDKMTSVTIEKR